ERGLGSGQREREQAAERVDVSAHIEGATGFHFGSGVSIVEANGFGTELGEQRPELRIDGERTGSQNTYDDSALVNLVQHVAQRVEEAKLAIELPAECGK